MRFIVIQDEFHPAAGFVYRMHYYNFSCRNFTLTCCILLVYRQHLEIIGLLRINDAEELKKKLDYS